MTDKKHDDANLPAQIDIGRDMPLALRLWLEPAFFNHATRMATQLSRAAGFTPKHLLGNVEACFAVVEKALVWGLSPSAVAQCTYTTPSGSIGYEGKLCHAVLEASGQFEGGIRFEHYGTVVVKHASGLEEDFRSNDPKLKEALAEDGATIKEQHQWKKLAGKSEVKTSQKGNQFIVPTWGQKDAFGLGVTVIGQIKGEAEPRRFNFDLVQAWPRNSTLWATAPDRQIMYTAVRAFGNHVVPALLLGMPSADEYDSPALGFENAKDLNPRPTKPAAETAHTVTDVFEFSTTDGDGVVRSYDDPMKAHDEFVMILKDAGTPDLLEGIWESNAELLTLLRENDLGAVADSLVSVHDEALEAFDRAAQERVKEREREQTAARQREADEAVAAAQREKAAKLMAARMKKAAEEKKPEPEAQKEPEPAPQPEPEPAPAPEVDAAVAAAEAAADAAAEEAAYAAADVQDDGRQFEEQQDEPVEENTAVHQDDDALPPEPEKPKAALPPRKNEDFWQRADYGMTPPKNPKGQPDWMKWNGWMQLAVSDARNIDELTKLDLDNLNWLKQMESAGAGYARGAHNLRDQISVRSRQLTDEEV